MKHIYFRRWLGACLVLGSVQAHATLVDFQGFANGSRTINYSLSSPHGTTTGSVAAGGLSTLVDGAPQRTTYSIDLYEHLDFSDAAYSDYQTVSGLVYTFANPNAALDIGRLFSAGHSLNNAVMQAAFQIAIWEVAYETSGDYGLSTGSAMFKRGDANSNGALTLADNWLDDLDSVANRFNVQVLRSVGTGGGAGHQDQVFADLNPVTASSSVNRVPEPSSMALAVVAIMGLGFVRRRRPR